MNIYFALLIFLTSFLTIMPNTEKENKRFMKEFIAVRVHIELTELVMIINRGKEWSH